MLGQEDGAVGLLAKQGQEGTKMVHNPPIPSVGLGAQDHGQLWG